VYTFVHKLNDALTCMKAYHQRISTIVDLRRIHAQLWSNLRRTYEYFVRAYVKDKVIFMFGTLVSAFRGPPRYSYDLYGQKIVHLCLIFEYLPIL
jgi:hypothetical protein